MQPALVINVQRAFAVPLTSPGPASLIGRGSTALLSLTTPHFILQQNTIATNYSLNWHAEAHSQDEQTCLSPVQISSRYLRICPTQQTRHHCSPSLSQIFTRSLRFHSLTNASPDHPSDLHTTSRSLPRARMQCGLRKCMTSGYTGYTGASMSAWASALANSTTIISATK